MGHLVDDLLRLWDSEPDLVIFKAEASCIRARDVARAVLNAQRRFELCGVKRGSVVFVAEANQVISITSVLALMRIGATFSSVDAVTLRKNGIHTTHHVNSAELPHAGSRVPLTIEDLFYRDDNY